MYPAHTAQPKKFTHAATVAVVIVVVVVSDVVVTVVQSIHTTNPTSSRELTLMATMFPLMRS